ncbi:hypothetical protein H9635_11475 [Solibacillus sp. A46]|uniref:Uncharacterized protein n=1 Tax=Solibacillus faecavium TaxID=2762221 RepID=A0ABR8XZJ0_9BACL|nr:hypothetical protein [Solibacillus faecavium]MBD8037371.1 hypothetical protein [Solibacillus faecavium]
MAKKKEKSPLWEILLNMVLTVFVLGMVFYTFYYIDQESRSEEAIERKTEKKFNEFVEGLKLGSVYELVMDGNAILAVTINATTYKSNIITIEEYPDYIDQDRVLNNVAPTQVHYKVNDLSDSIVIYYPGDIFDFIEKFKDSDKGK